MAEEGELRERAAEVMGKIFRDGVKGDQMAGRALAPEFFDLASAFCFGGFWSRPELDIIHRGLTRRYRSDRSATPTRPFE